MKTQGHILVIGAAGMDIKGLPHQPLVAQASNPGIIRRSLGGVARNIAENLGRLELETVFLTALGDDSVGDLIMNHCSESGITMDFALRVPQGRTGSYISVNDPTGDLALAISDYEIVDYMDRAYFSDKIRLFEKARLLILDLNLSNDILDFLFKLAAKTKTPIAVDPTSPVRAYKLRDYLNQLYLVTPNAAETKSLCDLEVPAHDLTSAIQAAHHLMNQGTEIAIITLGMQGLAYAERIGGKGHISAPKVEVVDTTGAGDALTAGVIFGLANKLPLDEAMQLGVAAASITLGCEESVAPHLTPDLLYSFLTI